MPDMESKIVLNGNFRVTPDGRVFKIKDGVEVPAAICKTGRDGRYRVVTYNENGIQKNALVHRLIASAFLPNPDNYTQITHIDGDASNNAVENLRWCTPADTIQRARYFRLAKNAEPCAVCGEITLSKTGMCAKCRSALLVEQHRAEREEKGIEDLRGIDQTKLTPREKEYFELRQQGLALAEIAHTFGVSRQCVHNAFHNAKRRSTKIRDAERLSHQERLRITARIERKKNKADKLLREINEINESIRKDQDALANDQ